MHRYVVLDSTLVDSKVVPGRHRWTHRFKVDMKCPPLLTAISRTLVDVFSDFDKKKLSGHEIVSTYTIFPAANFFLTRFSSLVHHHVAIPSIWSHDVSVGEAAICHSGE